MFSLTIRGLQCHSIPLTTLKNNRSYAATTNGSAFSSPRQILTISKTRGSPSTSNDLKEAMCEKIPLHYDLLRNFRNRHGSSVLSQITVDNMYQGLNGVSTTVRETSEIDPKIGISFRGLTIPEVTALLPRRGGSPCPEAVFWLLLTGDVPTQEQTASLTADWKSRREKKKKIWSQKGGGVLGSVLKALPKSASSLGRMCIALTAMEGGSHMRDALRSGVMSHTHWEYAFEDSMELLAVLPAIVGLVSKAQNSKNFAEEGDWVDFLLDCLAVEEESKKSSLGDFLRLYIAVNADDGGGAPGAHVTQILGDSQMDFNQALAAGVLAYSKEPKSGTMLQYMDFQSKLQSILGQQPEKSALRDFLRVLVRNKDLVAGYKSADFCDPRYIALRDFARQHLSKDSDFKLSQDIAEVLTPMLKDAGRRDVWPEQSAVAGPIFQFYGFRDMEFNQVLLCMSRALGAMASLIWARATDASMEHPRSSCTYTYFKTLQKNQRKPKKSSVKYTKLY